MLKTVLEERLTEFAAKFDLPTAATAFLYILPTVYKIVKYCGYLLIVVFHFAAATICIIIAERQQKIK